MNKVLYPVFVQSLRLLLFCVGAGSFLAGECSWAQPKEAEESWAQPDEAAFATDADIDMDMDAEVDVIVVRGERIPDALKSTSEIVSILDSEDFSRAGDSDMAGALARLAGVSVRAGKFMVVRGLSERYGNVLLNSSRLSSPEPLRRVVPLDLFPTSIIRDSVVQKTYSADLPADFGGGVIRLRTKAIPETPFWQASHSLGFDDESSLQDGLRVPGGDYDFFGFDDDTRALPAGLAPYYANGPRITGASFSPQERQAIDLSFNIADTLFIEEKRNKPLLGSGFAGGTVFETSGGARLGLILNGGHGYVARNRNGFRHTQIELDNQTGGLARETGRRGRFLSTQRDVSMHLFSGFGMEKGNHELLLTTLVMRQTTSKVLRFTGTDEEERNVRNDRIDYIERQVLQVQLGGDHQLESIADMELSWRGAYGRASRDAPYAGELRFYRPDTGAYRYDFTGQNGGVSTVDFSELDDETIDLGFDIKLPLMIAERVVDAKMGLAYSKSERETKQRSYQLFAASTPPELETASIETVLSADVLGTDRIDFLQTGGGRDFPDNTSSGLETRAVYALADIELSAYLRFAAGIRWEKSEQEIATSVSGTVFSQDLGVLEGDYTLPSYTLTWIPFDNVQLRAGYSMTLGRPQFRELAPAIFVNTDTDLRYVGNPYLTNTVFKNYDLRAEVYFDRGEYASLGVFYKDIENPVEEFTTNALSGSVDSTSFLNAPSAELYGVELEVEKRFALENIGALPPFELLLKANYTYSRSQVSTQGEVTIAGFDNASGALPIRIPAASLFADGRPLQGQSDHLVNFQLGYIDDAREFEAYFLVNYASERIRQVERIFRTESSGRVTAAIPRVIEKPGIDLSLTFSKKMVVRNRDVTLSFKAANLLQTHYKATQTRGPDSVDFDRYDVGRVFSIKLEVDL